MADVDPAPVIFRQGIPCTIDLKDATLGQVVEQIQKTNAEKRETNPDEENELGNSPINLLIPDELKTLNVGDIMLTNLKPAVILTSISKSTNRAFTIEEVGQGTVLILRPIHRDVVVKAIRLPWLDTSDLRIGVSAAGMASNTMIGFATPDQPTAGTSGTVIEQTPEQKEAAQKELKRQAEERQAQLDTALKEQKEKASQKLEELQRAIVTIFEMHGEISGHQLPPPKMNIQERLGMIMLIGTPESVQIASEIINATNPENHTAAARPGNRLGDVIPMGGMRMGSGDGEMGFVRGSVGGMAPARLQLNEPSDDAFNRARKSPNPKR